MALNLYHRHGSNCAGGRSLHEMTYESDELRRNWKRCSCPIYASGTLSGHFRRKNTERSIWPEAKTCRIGLGSHWDLGRQSNNTTATTCPGTATPR